MSLAVEKLDGSMAKLTITVPAEEFTKAVATAYNKQKGKFSVPGFRKGKVPQAFIEKMYGPAVFYEDAANQLINEYYNIYDYNITSAFDKNEFFVTREQSVVRDIYSADKESVTLTVYTAGSLDENGLE